MENKFLTNKLHYVILPTRRPPEHMIHYYHQIYKCWYLVWQEALGEFYGKDHTLYSDAFTRQDYAAGLFFKKKCIGVFLFTYVDLSLDVWRKDSYFKIWSPPSIEKLCNINNHVVMANNLSVHPMFRKNGVFASELNVNIKNLLVGLYAYTSLMSGGLPVTATPRKDRGVHNTTYRWGAHIIESDTQSPHGDLVDLSIFLADKFISSEDDETKELVINLSKSCADFRSVFITQQAA